MHDVGCQGEDQLCLLILGFSGQSGFAQIVTGVEIPLMHGISVSSDPLLHPVFPVSETRV